MLCNWNGDFAFVAFGLVLLLLREPLQRCFKFGEGLDTQAAELCRELGVSLVRAATVGVHPAFVSMVRELILEQTQGCPPRFLGALGPDPDACSAQCCPAPVRPAARPAAQ